MPEPYSLAEAVDTAMRLSIELDRRKFQAPTEDQEMLHTLARCVVSLAVVVQKMKNDERREQTRTGPRLKA